MKFMAVLCCCIGLCMASLSESDAPCRTAGEGKNLLKNGGFEAGMDGWNVFWTRDEDVGRVSLDTNERHCGMQGIRIEHSGGKDWSFAHSLHLKVHPGEIYEMTAWVRIHGLGNSTIGVVTIDATGKTINWAYGRQSTHKSKDWQLLRTRFIIPSSVSSIWPRIIGKGPATVWLDDVVLTQQKSLDELRNKNLPATQTVRNNAIEVILRTADAGIEVKYLRTDRSWIQRPDENSIVVLDAKIIDKCIKFRLFDPASMREIAAMVQLDGKSPECIVTLKVDGKMDAPLVWPAPFSTSKGQFLILPVNEGISYPVDDSTLPSMHYHLYGGHGGLCMPWYGVTEGTAGWMAIVETPDDASIRITRRDNLNLLVVVPEWEPQKGQFGPERVIRYIFFDHGGYVAMAKRYREHAKKTGLFKTLEEKRKNLPAVDLLVGAANVWCWDSDAPAICREMRAAGIDRILWSNARPPTELKVLNDMGVLTSRYDIYQDAMNPANFSRLQWMHSDWTSEAWVNNDLMIGVDNEWIRGWEVETKDGGMIPCGVLCDRQALSYAKKRIPSELATHPYRCRFIDTTTASPWRECYHPKHPMTRTESKQCKMELLRYISKECDLVCGSETGHDAAVPFVHYFEGMLSICPYRIPDAGRNMIRVWNDVTEEVAKFQTGHVYRIPLWELVYHDCVVAQWYWGDYNNKLPKLWDRRDLWNALYGTPPMFMFSRKSWETNRDRFVRSYRTAAPVARATGYAEMLSHEWLTSDHAVQRTHFSNGIVVTVNFGNTPCSLPDGRTLQPLKHQVDGLPAK